MSYRRCSTMPGGVLGLTLSALLAPFSSGCDEADEPSNDPAQFARAPESVDFEFDWSAVPLPTPSEAAQLEFEGPPEVPASFGPWTVESFSYFTPDFFALAAAPGGLFAPLLPDGVDPFPPELGSGFFVGFTMFDGDNELVGFGSEQEVIDFEAATGETAYTLTIPGRGSLMLTQVEEFPYLFEEIDDMIANQEFVRVYDPPLVNIHTVPGTAKVVGGSGEFFKAKGLWREISIVKKIDLLTGVNDVGAIIQVAHF